MKNTVDYKEYRKEMKKVTDELNQLQHEMFCEKLVEIFEMSQDYEPIQLGINWMAIGTVTTDEAVKFSQLIQKAAELANGFKYNGFVIED